MDERKEKITLIFIPFLKIAIGFVLGYTFLDWLLFIRFHIFLVDDSIYNSIPPLGLPLIPLLIWLRPKIRLLKLVNREGKRGRLPDIYFLVATCAIGFPTMFMQSYLETATGKLTKLESISSIGNTEPTKYYMVHNYYVDKKDMGFVRYEFINTGSHGIKNTVMGIYIALPIFDKIADTINAGCNAWIGKWYNIPFSTELQGKELEDERRAFLLKSQQDFNNWDVQDFVYLDREIKAQQIAGFRDAIKRSKKGSLSDANIFTEVNEPFADRNGYTLLWAFTAFLPWSGAFLIMILIPSFDNPVLDKFKEGKVDNAI